MPRAALLSFAVAFFMSTACARSEPPGQEEWEAFISKPANQAAFDEFVAYLKSQHVDRVIEPSQLLRQGTDWEELKAAPFVFRPRSCGPTSCRCCASCRRSWCRSWASSR
ncbi:MAG: hypothetical protein QM765_45070 [Myxococcales bacterium]